MEKMNELEDKFKRRMKVICFLPAVVLFITIVYFAFLLLPLTQGHPVPASAVGILSTHYSALFVLLAIFSSVSAIVLIYCMVHLIRIKTLNTPMKMIWMLLLLATPVSFILFWYLQVKGEPGNIPMYTNID
jgi:uncharacterized membrane protein